MKKIIIRWIVYAVVFIAALISFSLYFNQGTTDMTIEMAEPTLPVAYIKCGDIKINEMHGYVVSMESNTIRDSITPVGDNREVSFELEKYGCGVSGIRIEVRSADGERLIEDTPVIDYSDYQQNLVGHIALKDLIEPGEEYNLILIATLSDGREVNYYTRIIQNENANLSEKIAFVEEFSAATFDKESIRELSTFLEPNSEGDNSTFGRVDIHSSLNQVSWGNLAPVRESDCAITVKEIGDTMASIQLQYTVSVNQNDEKSYYRVMEYYRIRKTEQRFYLLSYDRTMDRIFLLDKESFVNDKIMLGIQKDDVQMLESDGGEIAAFVNDGRLYSVNVDENKVARLFAFYDTPSDDARNQYRRSDIKILDVEENGNISFMVYGYMNRGTHEGEVGVEVCYYRNPVNTIEEQIFIPYNKSVDILKCDVEKLSYINSRGNFYVFMDGYIYKIGTEDLKCEVVVENIDEDNFCVSESGRTIMWQETVESDNNITSNLTVMDLATEKITMNGSQSSDYIRPIGFMNEDLIYGVCNKGDLIYNTLGDVTFPMNRLIIQSEGGTVLKEYSEEGIYITNGSIEGNQITLKRARKNDERGTFSDTTDDYITSNIEVKEGKNSVSVVVTDTYEKIYQLVVKKVIEPKTLKFLTPKEVLYEGGRSVKVKNKNEKNRFLVYGADKMIGVFDSPARAVVCAYEIRGTVVDLMGNEIYRRGEIKPRNQIMAIEEAATTESKNSLTVCIEAMLRHGGVSRNVESLLERGESVYNILSSNMKDVYVLNLTGCSMDMMLYYVNLDIPVLGLLNDGSAVLIIGFNEQNVVLMDPVEGTIYKKGMSDSREMFENNSNRFMTYAAKHNEQ